MRARAKVNLGEWEFAHQIVADKLPLCIREYQFHPDRKYRLDFAWPHNGRLAVEIDGGVWMKGGSHSLPSNILRDIEKHNLLVMGGWKCLRFTPSDVKTGVAIQGLTQLMRLTGAI